MATKTKRLVLDNRTPDDRATVTVTAEVPSTNAEPVTVWRATKNGHTATNPETGEVAVWMPGEIVADWAIALEQNSNPD